MLWPLQINQGLFKGNTLLFHRYYLIIDISVVFYFSNKGGSKLMFKKYWKTKISKTLCNRF